MRDYLIFDLDGTLIDSNPTCVAILQEMLDERGADRTIRHDEAAPYISLGGVQMVRALLGPACGPLEQELDDFRARYAVREIPPESVFTGVSAGLERLRDAGYGLAICSNKPNNLCLKVLDDTGLLPFFDLVVGARPGLRAKPAPDLLQAVLDGVRVTADRCVYIGDSEIDCDVASDAGMHFCFMTYGYAANGWQPHPASIFDQFDHFVEALLERPEAFFQPDLRPARVAGY
ncbi:MAG: HAD-IA family hydrolase [Sphingomonadales bacterium]|nr:HAD-IA family hydrolase [Sphingomonadales bacterium]